MNSFVCQHISEMSDIAKNILETFSEERIFAFYGKMGAGKTTFIKEICKQLEVSCNTSSPTFAIINDYPTEKDDNLYHFDFYRIKKPTDALDIGFEEYLYSGKYCFIEWSEKVEEFLPEKYIKVEIEVSENETRIIRLTQMINT